jgi:hypothetical protein
LFSSSSVILAKKIWGEKMGQWMCGRCKGCKGCEAGMQDFSIKALFPDHPEAKSDPRCAMVARVLQEIGGRAPQAELVQAAKLRHAFLCKPERLTLPDADHRTFLLYEAGAKLDTAQAFFAFRLAPDDVARWTILATPNM